MSYLEPAIVKSSPTSIDVDVEIVDCHVRLEKWRTLTDICAISILILIFFSFELQFFISFFNLNSRWEWTILVDTSAISILNLFFFSFEFQFFFLVFFLILYFVFDRQVRVEDSGRYQCSSRGRRQWVDLTVVESRIFWPIIFNAEGCQCSRKFGTLFSL